ncbi:MAG TPA: hypothetical protein VLE97_01960 [Gaiellaceae bacterium]|nr:hypothetical protein [Gaiellaceae bacterium]
MGAIVSLLGGARATAFALLAALLLIYAGWLKWDNHSLTADLATSKAQVATDATSITNLAASNASKDGAILVLQQDLKAAAGQAQAVEKARAAAISALTAAKTARDAALADARKLRGRLYAQDTASRAWAAAPSTRGITIGLRDAWSAARGDEGPSRGSAGPAVRGDSAGAGAASAAAAAPDAGLQDCRDGCFSNDQLRGSLDAALDTLGRCYDQLDAIATLSAKAKDSNTAKPGVSRNGNEAGLPADETGRTGTVEEAVEGTAAP